MADLNLLIDELRSTMGRLESGLNVIQDSILWIDEENRVIWCNESFCHLVGREYLQVVGNRVSELLALERQGQPVPSETDLFRVARERKGCVGAIYEFRRVDQSVALEISIYPVHGSRGETMAMMTLRDITQLRKTEEFLNKQTGELKAQRLAALNLAQDAEEARKRVEEANRQIQEAMTIKAEFTSMVSHELRTPLTVIKEGVGIVSDQSVGPLNPVQLDYLQTAQRNVDRLARLINDVLDYQRMEAGQVELHREEQDLNDLVLDALQGFSKMAAQKGLEFSVELARDLPAVPMDKDKVIQVLVNLINNALKFSEKGKITVRTERLGNAVRVSVQDEGIGVKAEDLPKLFQGFSQIPHEGRRRTGGTGLGLAICKKIVEMHRGRIGVDSTYGRGSTFYFLLPIVERRS